MDYHLDTIPVIDALNEDNECLLCVVQQKTDKMYSEAFLGGSVMSPETRVQVNEHGFCPRHFHILYEQKNRLGLALMTHTYMRETVRQLKDKEKKLPLNAKKSFLLQRMVMNLSSLRIFADGLRTSMTIVWFVKK